MISCPPDDPIETACRRWVHAHWRFHHDGSHDALSAYCRADEQLLAAFLIDWHQPDPRALALAYQAFRQALIEHEEPTSLAAASCDA